MSTANQRFSGSGTGTGTGKAPADKSSFAQTCNRLSLFLKEKGKLRDLGIKGRFDVLGKPETSPVITQATTTTVDLLSNMESSSQKVTETATETEKLMNILPRYARSDSFSEPGDFTKKASSSKEEPKAAQMTIFYGGQVLVIDDFPADRARDLMLVATSAPGIENRVDLASTSNPPSEVLGSQKGTGSNLPIMRQRSLDKFLAKRKDRAAVRAPYQLQNTSLTAAASSKNDNKFDLNL